MVTNNLTIMSAKHLQQTSVIHDLQYLGGLSYYNCVAFGNPIN
jgi:hypothetical protein